MIRNLKDCHLYGIIDAAYLHGRDPAEVATQMIKGGVDIIQLRAKNATLQEIRVMGKAILDVTQSAAIALIINDSPEVAKEIRANGVHVGQDDISIAEARQILGDGKWVGKSTHSLEQALAAEKEGADYIGFGPLFTTPTKPDYTPIGLQLVQEVNTQIKIPVFCIGGIKVENVKTVVAAGAQRFVVVSGILQAPDIVDYCQRLKEILNEKSKDLLHG